MRLQEILIAGVVLLLTDAVYLSFIASYFDAVVRRVQGASLSIDVLAAAICYVFLVGGLYWFIIRHRRSIWEAGVLGLVIYGVYETTNKAILKNWDWLTVLLDTSWGGALFVISTAITYWLLGLPVR